MTNEEKEIALFEIYMRNFHPSISLMKAEHSLMTYATFDSEDSLKLWQAARATLAETNHEYIEGCLGCDPFYNEGPNHEEHHFDACECCQRAQNLEMRQETSLFITEDDFIDIVAPLFFGHIREVKANAKRAYAELVEQAALSTLPTMTGEEIKDAERAISTLALSADPCNETMNAARKLRALIARLPHITKE